jgi:hypothetical protein
VEKALILKRNIRAAENRRRLPLGRGAESEASPKVTEKKDARQGESQKKFGSSEMPASKTVSGRRKEIPEPSIQKDSGEFRHDEFVTKEK